MALIAFAICAQAQTQTFTDSRDGKNYKTVKIGSQMWMAENLNYEAEGSVCYKNSDSNCDTYGRLYNWETAMKACPYGWHLPSDEEWQTLVDFAGGGGIAGTKLRAKKGWPVYDFSGTSLKAPKCKRTERKGEEIDDRGRIITPAMVVEHDKCATDEYGFSALPGGSGHSGGYFFYVGTSGTWWSSSEYSSYIAYRRGILDYNSNVGRYAYNKAGMFSVRCVQD